MAAPVEHSMISIVLPVRNAVGTLDECFHSICSQSFPYFEVIVINDGSSDDSTALLEHWCHQDKRIKLFHQKAEGLVVALNKGLALAQGEFIARMDADDIMHPLRLQTQLEYLTRHKEIDLLATQVELFAEHVIKSGYQEYIRWQNNCLSPRDIADEIYIESPIAHPSVMVRRCAIQRMGGYRQGDFPEDYDLWLRMLHSGMKLAKLPQTLLKWRDSDSRTSRTDERYASDRFDRLRAFYLAKDSRLCSKRPLVFWGAGRKTRARVRLLGKIPQAWIDVDPKKIGKIYDNAKVEGLAWLRAHKNKRQKPFVLSYVTNHGVRDLITQELHDCRFSRGDDYLMVG